MQAHTEKNPIDQWKDKQFNILITITWNARCIILKIAVNDELFMPMCKPCAEYSPSAFSLHQDHGGAPAVTVATLLSCNT